MTVWRLRIRRVLSRMEKARPSKVGGMADDGLFGKCSCGDPTSVSVVLIQAAALTGFSYHPWLVFSDFPSCRAGTGHG